jgi:hypothetical protein
VSKAELKALPKGTPFAQYLGGRAPWPGSFDILVGADEYIDDFYYRSTNCPDADSSEEMWDRQREMVESGAAYPVELSIGREGYYDPDTRYLVWEPDDVRRIVALLLGADKDEKDDE